MSTVERGVPPSLELRPANTRSPEQRAHMEDLAARGVCPFCPDHLAESKRELIEKGTYWSITKNHYPYAGTKLHYLALLNRHVSQLADLTPIEGAELIDLFARIAKQENIVGGSVAMRFGDHAKLKNSISHLHVHLIVPDVDDPNMADIKFSIAKNKPNV